MIKPAKQLKTQDKIKLSDDRVFTIRAFLNNDAKHRALELKLVDDQGQLWREWFDFDEEVKVVE